MSYIALYRKYRPLKFEDIVGQESVTKILKNQIHSGKISHAYIFSGCRGTGKTSAAKIFARAVNCLSPINGEPCNKCEVCKKILQNTTTDVIEMDAASNNSVENIRQIRQEVVYTTVDTKYRVYIIDEAHMLTTSAFNALLKTLEEPPENVIFILATTEQHKIPITILSRCLKFEFSRLSREDIKKRLKYVLEQEKKEYEEEALTYISSLADGALRDALSILDRCQSEEKEKLTYSEVLRIIGGIDNNIINDLATSILESKKTNSLEIVDELINKGKDLRQLILQLTQQFLDILIDKNDERKKYENVEESRLIYIIEKLSKLENDLKYALSGSILIKSCIVELCSSIVNNVNDSQANIDVSYLKKLEDKIYKLEEEILNLKKMGLKSPVSATSNNIKIDTGVKNLDTSKICDTFDMLDDLKKECARRGKLKIYSALSNVRAFNKENILLFIVSNKFAYELLTNNENVIELTEIINTFFNKEYIIKVELKDENEEEESIIEKVLKESGINYKLID